ncbi:hypothetical protein [Ruminococcus sp.]
MKDELDMMFSKNEKDIERISGKYAAAGRKEKEKIYKISMKKYEQLKAQEESDDGFTVEASGVERYRRPMLYRGISAVAATMVLVSGLAGGLLLAKNSRIPKLDMNDSVNTGQSTVVNEIAEDNRNSDVDTLVDNFGHIMRELYIADDGYESGVGVTFYKDAVDPETGEMYKKDLVYYNVTDEKLNDPEKLKKFMDATFAPKLNAYYLGGDLSGHEDGEDFADDGMASRYLRPFIVYNGVVLADHIDDDMSYNYKYHEVYDFSNYKLVSSVFDDNTESFEDELGLENMFMQYDESDMQSVVCSRVYQRDDGVLISADFLLKKGIDNWKIADYSIMYSTEKKQTEAESAENTQPTTASEIEDNDDYGELQLHEEKIFANVDEVEEFNKKVNEETGSGVFQFRKVNTEKYAQQIWNAEGYDELNTLENKSYIYHILLNSYRYFDTADVVYTTEIKHSEGTAESSVHCMADTRNKRFCLESEFSDVDDYYDHVKLYSYDGIWINADETKKTYFEDVYYEPDYDLNYIPDNYIYTGYYGDDGNIYYYTYSNIVFAGKCQDCLFNTSESDMFDFENWYIDDTEEILGRQCVSVKIERNGYSCHKYIDLRNGIIMQSTEDDENDPHTRTMTVKSIKTDMPLEYIYFDPTGYTKDSD